MKSRLLAMFALVLIGCTTTPPSEAKRETLDDDSHAAINRMMREDAGLKNMVDNAYGYAIFPDVGKGGLIVGGAYGRGEVYERGVMTGYADLRQATVGAQLGGQTFAELIVFQNREALEKFKANQLAFTANASAVAIKKGAAAAARYDNGVAVFTMPNGGLMFEASVGGQQFTYTSKENAGAATRPAEKHTTVEETTEHRSSTDHDGKGVKVDVNVQPK
jgi:lipid-binding SYLF domain-containing protein